MIVPNEKRERIRAVLPALRELVLSCRACGHACGANRMVGATGACGAGLADGERARWQAAVPHFGEEPMLVGKGGSGTVFFSHCTMRCVFCQNWQISHEGEGREGSVSELAAAFLRLQSQGVENINLVTPTQYILPIVLALDAAYAQGLTLPVVYNTNGYDAEALIALLDGIVDIWLPDLKYMDADAARRLSRAPAYPATAQAALRAMWRQAGPLRLENGIAARGVILRHLILPEDLAGSFAMLLWLRDEGMTEITLSLMSQYSPQYRAAARPEIARAITPKEYYDVVDFAEKLGFEHLLIQEMTSTQHYLPDFDRESPFQDIKTPGP